MLCPKCHQEMKSAAFKDVKYDQCKGCGGLWFDALEAEDLVEIEGAAKVDTGDSVKGAELNGTRKIECPVCNVRMHRVHDVQQPHIQLETCGVCHGTFFDAGEFTDFAQETFSDRVKDWLARRH